LLCQVILPTCLPTCSPWVRSQSDIWANQTYAVRPIHEDEVIELSVFRYTTNDDDPEANVDTIELVYTLQGFISDALKQHMKAFPKFYIHSYIPCSKCDQLHAKFEKAKSASVVPCTTIGHNTKCDITQYHMLFSTTTAQY